MLKIADLPQDLTTAQIKEVASGVFGELQVTDNEIRLAEERLFNADLRGDYADERKNSSRLAELKERREAYLKLLDSLKELHDR